jgi:hypothetical protein
MELLHVVGLGRKAVVRGEVKAWKRSERGDEKVRKEACGLV